MSIENVALLVFAAILCCLNLAFGPLAETIAKAFARISSDRSPVSRTGSRPEGSESDAAFGPTPEASGRYETIRRTDGTGSPTNETAERRQLPPGPDDSGASSYTTRTGRAIGETRISKYR
jgi:hypothetical protein